MKDKLFNNKLFIILIAASVCTGALAVVRTFTNEVTAVKNKELSELRFNYLDGSIKRIENKIDSLGVVKCYKEK